MKKEKCILIFNEVSNELNNIVGGIYTGITENTAIEEIGAENILYYIPLKVCGKTYQERRDDVRNKAIEYQNSWYDFCGFAYNEIGIITDFFQAAAKKYGLITEFKENGII